MSEEKTLGQIAFEATKSWMTWDHQNTNRELWEVTAQAVIAELQEEIAELKKDAKRIDWLARNSKTCTVYGNGTARFFPNLLAAHLYGTTYREAIDAAIAAEEQAK